MTYNGEVYNYPELRAELGGSWRTGTDTEVVLRAHERWGAERARPPARDVRLRALGRGRAGAALRARPLRHQALLLRAGRRRPLLRLRGEGAAAVRSRRSRPTSRGSRTTWPSSSASPARRCSRASASCCRATSCACAAASLRPTRYWEVYYDLDFDHTAKYFEERIESLLAESVRLHLRSDVPVAAYLSGGLDSSAVASLASRSSSERMKAFTGRFPEDDRYDESAYARDLAECARPRPARGRHRRRRLPRHDRGRRLPHGLPGGRPRIVPAVHGLPGREPRGQGDPRRPGRRRDLRRLHALPDRLLRAVHQGRHRRDHAQRQLRRHLRVDHPQPRRAAELQAADEGVLARGAVRGSGRPLLPADQPGAAAARRGRPRRARGLLAVRDVPDDLQRRQRRPRVLLRQDDPLRLQDAAARAAPGRGPREHGPRPGVARAAAGPRARGAGGDDPGRRQVQRRHDEARLQAGHALDGAGLDREPEGQDGLSGAAPGVDARTGARVRDRRVRQRARARRDLFDNRKVLAGLERENRFGRQTWGLLCLELWQRAFHDREQYVQGSADPRKEPTSEGPDHRRGRVHRLPSSRSAVG